MPNFTNPRHALDYHVSGAIARGTATPIVEQPATPAPVKLASAARDIDPGPLDRVEALELATHKRHNPHNFPRVDGFPPLSPHYVCKRDAQAQGRAAPFGAPLPDNVRPGSAWAVWFMQGNGPLRDIEGEGAA